MNSILKLIYDEEIDAVKREIVFADLAAVDTDGDTAFHMAVLKKNIEIVNLLLQFNCNTNAKNKHGKTPLHYTADLNLIDIAKLLLEKKANLSISDNFNNQPLWSAVFSAAKGELEKLPIVELFLQHGADKNHKNNAGRSPLDFANQVGFKPLIELLEKY